MKTIEVNELTKSFGDFIAVDKVSFSVSKGEVFGFLGANGAGKSTTIKMLCGILCPTTGDAFVGGYSVMNAPDKVKQQIGYMSQKFSLYNDLTVEENIKFFGGIYGLYGNKLEERKEWVLGISDLKGKENLITDSLPGGIKQRLALGTAVIHKPAIVFLDEPTSGVDPIARRQFWELINQISDEGTTVLVTTHYLEEAEYCNNIILINAGRLIAKGTPASLKKDFLKNKIIEVECNNTVAAMDILLNEYFVDDISIFGNNIHLNVNDLYKSSEQIIYALSNQKMIDVKRIDSIIPTLEDVFIYLLEKDKK